MKKILFVFGTRPEAIKLIPLVKVFKEKSNFEVLVYVTGQHRQMLDQMLTFFDIKPDVDLDLMANNQTLFDITTKTLIRLQDVISDDIDLILVQGDTTTAMAAALAGFYKKIPVAHVEAGLRSNNNYSPYPEEVNRKIIGQISTLNFCPTNTSLACLKKESELNHAAVTGNTVIDALFLTLNTIKNNKQLKNEIESSFLKSQVDLSKKIILITGHRRENFGEKLIGMCNVYKKLANEYKDILFVYPVHLNPNVQKPVYEILGNVDNLILLDPLDYPNLIYLLSKSYLVITDSGGIQEEAPSLNVPVIVTREETERGEGVVAGCSVLVGTDPKNIYEAVKKVLENTDLYKQMSNVKNPYGDGTASIQILEQVSKFFNVKVDNK